MCVRRLSVREKVELKSQIKENSRNPEWNEHFRLLVYRPDQEVWRLLSCARLDSAQKPRLVVRSDICCPGSTVNQTL